MQSIQPHGRLHAINPTSQPAPTNQSNLEASDWIGWLVATLIETLVQFRPGATFFLHFIGHRDWPGDAYPFTLWHCQILVYKRERLKQAIDINLRGSGEYIDCVNTVLKCDQSCFCWIRVRRGYVSRRCKAGGEVPWALRVRTAISKEDTDKIYRDGVALLEQRSRRSDAANQHHLRESVLDHFKLLPRRNCRTASP